MITADEFATGLATTYERFSQAACTFPDTLVERLYQVQVALYYTSSRTMTVTLPVYRADESLGYVVLSNQSYHIKHREIDDELTEDADVVACVVAVLLARHWSDAVDVRRHRPLIALARGALSAASEGDRQIAGYALRDYLAECGYAT